MAKTGAAVRLVCLLGLTGLVFGSPRVMAEPAGVNPVGTTDTPFQSGDRGETWNQVGLIESEMTSLIDLAASPDYPDDETLFLLTWGGEHNLWRSQDGGEHWELVFTSAPSDSLSLVSMPPQDGVVYLAGTNSGNPAIWRSTDNGQSFSPHPAPAAVDAWVVASQNTLFLTGYDGSRALVYRTGNGGQSFASPATVGSAPLSDITLSPDYPSDETILAGASDGRVYWSDDSGGSFEPLPGDTSALPLEGTVSVAFDADFSRNRTVYAAGDSPGGGIWRFVIGESHDWEAIGLPADGMVGDLAVSASGVLYAADFREAGGLARSLDPAYPPGPTFETLAEGLEAGATLTHLWLPGTRLWAVDTANNRLVTLSDSLSQPVSLLSPEDGAEAVGTTQDEVVTGVTLEWETLPDATKYEWQLNDDADFSEVLFSGHTGADSRKPPDLEPDTAYYWRVRASEPVLSPWSEEWSFTTSAIAAETIAAPKLTSPKSGARDVPSKPLFRWSAVTGASDYELILSTRESLAKPVILKSGDHALSNTEWQCNIGLDYETTYYWRVRGISSDTEGDWSEVGDFTTLKKPAPVETITPAAPKPAPAQAAEPAPETPVSPASSALPNWVRYLIVGLAIGVVILSAVMINRRGKRKSGKSWR